MEFPFSVRMKGLNVFISLRPQSNATIAVPCWVNNTVCFSSLLLFI